MPAHKNSVHIFSGVSTQTKPKPKEAVHHNPIVVQTMGIESHFTQVSKGLVHNMTQHQHSSPAGGDTGVVNSSIILPALVSVQPIRLSKNLASGIEFDW